MSDIRRYEHLWAEGLRLNVGCARNQLPGFLNIDIDPRCHPDMLVEPGKPWPFPSGQFNFVLMSHILEHVRDPFPLLDDVWRVLRPGGHVLIVVPHGMSEQQMGTPAHVVAYNAMSFTAFTTQRYETPGDHGYGAYEGKPVHPWELVRIDHELKHQWPRWLVWLPTFLEPYIWNLYANIYCVMRKPSDASNRRT